MRWQSKSAAAALLSLVCPLWADRITLKDGRELQGHMVRREQVYEVRQNDGSTIQVPVAEVLKVVLADERETLSPDQIAWERLGYQLTRLHDLQQIIDAYEKFLGAFPASQRAAEAQSALSNYRQMQLKGFVRWGTSWIPPAQRDVIVQESMRLAQEAVVEYRQGNIVKTLQLSGVALKSWPDNPLALTYQGLANYRRGLYVASREAFERLRAVEPNNALALNNIAVILFLHQMRRSEALATYYKALLLEAQNRQIIDNVNLALHHYTESKTSQVYLQLEKAYQASAGPVEQAMQDYKRFGGAWIDKLQFEKIDETNRQANLQIANCQAQFDELTATQNQLQMTLQQINANQALLSNQIANLDYQIQRQQRTNNGLVDASLVSQRTTAQNDYLTQNLRHQQLEDQLRSVQARFGSLRTEAITAKSRLIEPSWNFPQLLLEPR